MLEVYSSPSLRGVDLTHYSAEIEKQRMISAMNNRMSKIVASHSNVARIVKPSSSMKRFSCTSPEVQEKFTPSAFCSVFQSGDMICIDTYCTELVKIIPFSSQIGNAILNDETCLQYIIDFSGNLSTNTQVSSYLSFILAIGRLNFDLLLDNSILFVIRDIISEFPIPLLQFYSQISIFSSNARNGLICLGIIDDIIDICINGTDDSVAIHASLTLKSIFSQTDQLEVNSIRPLITQLASIFSYQRPIDLIINIMNTIAIIANQLPQIIPDLYSLGVHSFIIDNICDSQITEACLSLLGSMAICCNSTYIQELIDSGVVELVAGFLTSSFCSASVFSFLTNCIESAPNLISPLIDDNLLSATAEISINCPYDLFKEATYFAATLLLFVPSSQIVTILNYGLTSNIIEMLDCGIARISIRCIDSLSRVLVLSYTAQSIFYLMNLFFESPELIELLNNLVQQSDVLVRNKAQNLIDELEEIRTSNNM